MLIVRILTGSLLINKIPKLNLISIENNPMMIGGPYRTHTDDLSAISKNTKN